VNTRDPVNNRSDKQRIVADAVDMETGTSSFLDRQALSRRFEENLEVFLADHGFKVLPFGNIVILQDNSWIRSRLKKVDYKESLAAVMVKFAPDYIVVKETDPKDFFFMDAKASITPVFFQTQIDRIREHHGKDPHLSRNDIGEIEREAWFSYNKLYGARVLLVIATPYNQNLILAEWVSNITCMWCLKEALPGNPMPWDCSSCPVYATSKEGFDVMVNELAGGSGTPHTNIHFGSMRRLDVFLMQEYAVQVDADEYEQTMLEYVKQWPLNKPVGRVNWTQFNNVVRQLRYQCPWLKCRIRDKFIPCPGEDQRSFPLGF